MSPYCLQITKKQHGNVPESHIFPYIARKLYWDFFIFPPEIPIFILHPISVLFTLNLKMSKSTFFHQPLLKRVNYPDIKCKIKYWMDFGNLGLISKLLTVMGLMNL